MSTESDDVSSSSNTPVPPPGYAFRGYDENGMPIFRRKPGRLPRAQAPEPPPAPEAPAAPEPPAAPASSSGTWTPGDSPDYVPPAQPQVPADDDAGDSSANMAAVLAERRASALRVKAGLDSMSSSLEAMNSFLNGNANKAAAPQSRGPQPQNPHGRGGKDRHGRFDRRGDRNGRFAQNPQNAAPQRPATDNPVSQEALQDAAPAAPVAAAPLPTLRIADLQALSLQALLDRCAELRLADDAAPLSRHDLVMWIAREHVRRGGTIEAEGYLEIWQEGHGFLRSIAGNLKTCPEDVLVPQSLVASAGLRAGDFIVGRARLGDRNQRERRLAVEELVSVNGADSLRSRRRPPFGGLEVVEPSVEADLTGLPKGPLSSLRFGERVLLVGPRAKGGAALLENLARTLATNHPDTEVFLALVNAAPETVVRLRKAGAAGRFHVVASEFEDFYDKPLQLAGNLTDIAKRKVESGENVVVLFDSVTALALAYGVSATTQQGVPSDGIDGRSVQKARRLVGAARATEGASFTLVATAYTDGPSSAPARVIEELAPVVRQVAL